MERTAGSRAVSIHVHAAIFRRQLDELKLFEAGGTTLSVITLSKLTQL